MQLSQLVGSRGIRLAPESEFRVSYVAVAPRQVTQVVIVFGVAITEVFPDSQGFLVMNKRLLPVGVSRLGIVQNAQVVMNFGQLTSILIGPFRIIVDPSLQQSLGFLEVVQGGLILCQVH